MTRITNPALSLFLLALISACGGSDGDGTRGSGDDRDGDGLSDSYETNTSGTSPLLADTDGDGYDDGEEVNERSFNPTTNPFRFNPLVADIPKFEVQVGERPRLTVICTEGTEATREFSTSETNETSSSVSNSQSGEESLALELGVTVGSEASFGTDGIGGGVNSEVSASETNTTTVGWSSEQTSTNTDAYTRSASYAETNNETCTGGEIVTTANLVNTGHIAFRVDNLTLTAQRHNIVDPKRLEPVGNLLFDTAESNIGSFPVTTLAQGQNLELVYANKGLPLSEIRAVMNNSRSLVLGTVPPELTDSEGVAFAHSATQINDRTVAIIIDYGDERDPERYRVAANPDPDNLGITVGKALMEHMYQDQGGDGDYETGSIAWDFDGDGSTDGDTFPGLTRVRNVAADASTFGYWVVAHTFFDGVDEFTRYYSPIRSPGYDFDAIELKAGDKLQLAYIKDADQDGLGNRAEFLYRTNPNQADTDGDTLDDGVEIEGWWITLNGTPVQVHSDPTLRDTDGDGDTDDVELLAGTHPNNRGEPEVSDVNVSSDGLTATATARVEDPDGQVVKVTFDWGDDSAPSVVNGSNILLTDPVDHTYAEQGRYKLRVIAEDNGGVQNLNSYSTWISVPDSLLAHYKLDGDTTDSGPRARDAIANQWVSFEPGRFADQFSGTTGAVGTMTNSNAGPSNENDIRRNLVYGPHLGFTESFTIAMWLIDYNPNEAPRYVGQGDWYSLYQATRNVDGRPVGYMTFGPLSESIPTAGAPSVQDPEPMTLLSTRWTFWVGTAEYDGNDTVLSLYRNGELVRQTTAPDTRLDNPGECSFYIGPGSAKIGEDKVNASDPSACQVTYARTNLPGSMDDVRVYDRALTPTEVLDLYQEKNWPDSCALNVFGGQGIPCPLP